MPYPFYLPTTSTFQFSAYFESSSHPSLPLSSSTYRGVLRDTLKKHKRLSPTLQSSNLSSVLLSLTNYLPYLLAIDAGLGSQIIHGEEVHVILKSTPQLEWRPVLTAAAVPGREPPRIKLTSLEYEIYFVYSTLAYTHILLARTALQPLYSSTTASPSPEVRTSAIQTATKHLLTSASIHAHLANISSTISTPPPNPELSTSTFAALSSLSHAEATLLAVLKDDPYPATLAQSRNANDKEWMIRAPSIPKVRAHLFARLCLAASEHAVRSASLLSSLSTASNSKAGKIEDGLLKYINDLRITARAKAARFFAIDTELSGQTGEALAWLQAGKQSLGLDSTSGDKKSGLGRLKSSFLEKREDKKVEKGTTWGSDAGKAEEGRVIEWLEAKWTKMNDTINTQIVPPVGPLLASMPSGREIHVVQPYTPPIIDAGTLAAMRAPPDRDELVDVEGDDSSDEEERTKVRGEDMAGLFPGTRQDYGSGGSKSDTPAYY